MADRADFKHIKVTESDDDVVIVAGARPAEVHERTEVQQQSEQGASHPVSANATRAVVSQASEPADTYRATTLEDIQASKMPVAQKVVLALAVVAVVAFIVWNALPVH